MVALAQTPPAAKIGVPALMLANEHVDAPLLHARDAEVAGKVAIGHDHIARPKLVHQAPQQRGFSGLLALARAAGPLQRRAARQRDNADQTGQREAQSGFLPGALRKCRLVFRRIRHRHRRFVNELDVATAPQPPRRLRRHEPRAKLATESFQQPHGQPLPGFAVGAGVQAARPLPKRHPRAQPMGHGVLAAVIGPENLLDEQSHRRERTVKALPPAPGLLQPDGPQYLSREDLAQRRSRRLNKARPKPPNLFGETPFFATLHLG